MTQGAVPMTATSSGGTPLIISVLSLVVAFLAVFVATLSLTQGRPANRRFNRFGVRIVGWPELCETASFRERRSTFNVRGWSSSEQTSAGLRHNPVRA
jgi:hypothetical protein